MVNGSPKKVNILAVLEICVVCKAVCGFCSLEADVSELSYKEICHFLRLEGDSVLCLDFCSGPCVFCELTLNKACCPPIFIIFSGENLFIVAVVVFAPIAVKLHIKPVFLSSAVIMVGVTLPPLYVPAGAV